MITRAEDMKIVERQNVKGGEGAIKMSPIVKKGSLNKGLTVYAKFILEPGVSTGHHEHTGNTEVFYILQGHPQVKDNDTVAVLHPGDALITSDGDFHSIVNNTEENVELISMVIKKDQEK